MVLIIHNSVKKQNSKLVFSIQNDGKNTMMNISLKARKNHYLNMDILVQINAQKFSKSRVILVSNIME